MAQLTRVEAKVWLQIYESLKIPGKLAKPHIDDNLFSSLQWMGKDVITKADRLHWALVVNGVEVSYLQSYMLSKSTMRLRGLCTKPEHQGRGYMKTLMNFVLREYQGKAQEALCFAGEPGLGVCKSAGFKLDERFEARHVEYFDSSNQKWLKDETSKIVLLRKELTLSPST